MQEYTLNPGHWTNGIGGESVDERKVSFTGEIVAEHIDGNLSQDTRVNSITVYHTEGNNFIVEEEHNTLWEGEASTRSVTVCQTWKELEDIIPDHLLADVEDSVGKDSAVKVE